MLIKNFVQISGKYKFLNKFAKFCILCDGENGKNGEIRMF